jgi:hypothetical protein
VALNKKKRHKGSFHKKVAERWLKREAPFGGTVTPHCLKTKTENLNNQNCSYYCMKNLLQSEEYFTFFTVLETSHTLLRSIPQLSFEDVYRYYFPTGDF